VARDRVPASWMAIARPSFSMYSIPIAVPDSSVVIDSTRSPQLNRSRPEWWAIVSAIDVTCSIIAGE
jgi:hypothetical protein